MKTALTVITLLLSLSASAQEAGSMYVAPGMAVHLAKKKPVAAKKSIELPVPLAVLPRFWRGADNVTINSEFLHFVDYFRYTTRYPQAAKSILYEGRVYVRAIIAETGEATAVEVINHKKLPASYPANHQIASDALEAEAIRVMQAVRFEPLIGRADTIVVPLIYNLP